MTRKLEVSSDSIDEISEHEYIRKFAKQMLKNTLFIGTFQENRFVESLNSYRNVIKIANEEDDFIKNLLAVKKRIDDSFLKRPWIGVSEPDTIGAPVGYNLWVELREEVFGMYWYKVKTVEFLRNEIRLKLDIIRPVRREHTPLRTVSDDEGGSKPDFDNFDFVAFFKDNLAQIKQNFTYFFVNVLTFGNVKRSVIFISLLIGTIIAGGVSIIQYLMEYMLLLIRELSGLIKAITPIIITCVNVLGKTIFGFYSMIVALFRDKRKQQPVYNAYYSIDPGVFQSPNQRYNQYFNKELPYYPAYKPRISITPLDN